MSLPATVERSPVILDASGQPMERLAYGDSAFNSASRGREMRDWDPSWGSADADMYGEREETRYRARDLDRNEPLATGAINTIVEGVVGTGLLPIPTPDWRILGKTKAWADDWSMTVRAIAREYYDSTDVDAARIGHGGEMQQIMLRNALLSGACCAIVVWRDDDHKKWSTCLHPVEIDRLSNPNGAMDGEYQRGGITIDVYGKPLAYSFQHGHPGDLFWQAANLTWTTVPAETAWGRPLVLHVFERDRPGQTHGMSFLSSMIPGMRGRNKFVNAEVQASVNNAQVAALLKSAANLPDLMAMFKGDANAFMQARGAWNSKFKGIQNGAVVPMFPGDSLESYIPGRPNPNAVAFLKAMARDTVIGSGLPLEYIDGDWTGMNYSNARTALLQARRRLLGIRDWFVRRLCQPHHRCWMEEAVHKGRIPDCKPSDFEENTDAWTRARYQGPGMGWLDPVKEVQSEGMKVSFGFSTLQKVCADQGEDWREIADQKAAEKKYYEQELGIPYPGDQAPIGERNWQQDDGQDDDGEPQPGSAPAKPAKAAPAKRGTAVKPPAKPKPAKPVRKAVRHAA